MQYANVHCNTILAEMYSQTNVLPGANVHVMCMILSIRGSKSFARGDPILTTFLFSFLRVERIQIALKAGHHRPASETPF